MEDGHCDDDDDDGDENNNNSVKFFINYLLTQQPKSQL
jgi:hypothetical protein